MTHPIRTASRAQRRSQQRGRAAQRARTWRHGAVRPVAMAVWLSLAGADVSTAWAGSMNPSSATRGLSQFALPVPVVPFKNGNIASYGTGTGTVTVQNQGKTNETTSLLIEQSTSKAIYQWQSFDIGQLASVTFLMPGANSAALNRVSNSASASQIFGSLSSYYKDSAGKLAVGGDIYLINRNGILFGAGSKVNVGGLFASALNMSDEDFKAGLKSITENKLTFFKWVDKDNEGKEIATYDPETNYVKVEAGAQINTASGGRVFLLGGKVENAGSIRSENGQVVLAAGSDVYLNTPTKTNSPLYMSEANENVPAVKGLLVEVDSARKANEVAVNTGSISTPLGNTTIVGWAVNQSGRVSATTGVGQNGSVFLQARSGLTLQAGVVTEKAKQGGQLTLGQGSSIEITPDASNATVAANTTFTASRIELSGKTIDIQDGASIKAPGAVVNVRAEATPSYFEKNLTTAGNVPDKLGRITVGAGAVIDVSGTRDTNVSVARNFVTTALLGANDLKDAPVQKSGPIYRSTLTFDIREGAPILGDTSAYLNAVQKTANEFMSVGGKLTLAATGAVVTSNTASLNVSGGAVNYTSAQVNPSVLLGVNGQRYTLNNAPVDQVYVGIAGHGGMTPSRFGPVTAPSVAGMAHLEEGYTQGSAAGQLSVVAPKVVLDAQVKGTTIVGRRQLAGLDAMGAMGKLIIGNIDTGTVEKPAPFGSADFGGAVLGSLTVSRESQSLSDIYNSESLPAQSRISAAQLNDSGFGSVTIASTGDITVQDGADLVLPQQGALTLRAAGREGIDLGGNIRSTGGKVSIQTLGETPLSAQAEKTPSGTLTLRAGKTIDVSGNWVNQRRDGGGVASAVAGGSVALSSGHALILEQGSGVDVSGGATVGSTGAVKGSNAGAISLISNAEASKLVAGGTDPLNIKAFEMGATLQGYGVSKGGSLSMKAGSVSLVDNVGTASGLKQGDTVGSVVIGKDFLTKGGFQSYTIDGITGLSVAENVTLAPSMNNWVATSAARNLATGSKVSQAMEVAKLVDGQRAATNLTLRSSGVSGAKSGVLEVGKGARILGDAGSTLSLQAGSVLEMNGAMRAAGGQINLSLINSTTTLNDFRGSQLHLGETASLDVSGTTVYQPNTSGLKFGQVLDGGRITIDVSANNDGSAVLMDAAAILKADGTTGELDIARPLGATGPAYTRHTVASNGGDIDLRVGGSGGGVLASQLSAKAGDSTASGGSFTLKIGGQKGSSVIRLQDGAPSSTLKNGEVTVSTKMLQNSGVADVTLTAPNEINFASSLDWMVPRHLTLNAPTVSASGESVVTVKSGSTLRMGRSANLGATVTQLATGDANALLSLRSGLVGLFGQQALKGVKTLDVKADTEVRLMGVNEGDAASLSGQMPGGLLTRADVKLHAPQVTVASATKYTLDASGATVTIDGGDINAPLPLSAGGQLTVNAKTINQNGVLRVPFGSITLNATEAINLGEGETSVSGQNLVVPFGSTTGGGTTLTYLTNGTVSAPVEKAVVLDASGRSVTVSSNATIDLSGGGSMLSYEFVPGPGGSQDVFAGALNGAFAVVPTVTQYAPTDGAILAGLNQDAVKGNTLALGNTITFGDNAVVPKGTYAILPARYALLEGAYLVKPASGTSSNVSLNYSQGQTDGSAIVGAVLGTTGVKTGNAQPSAFVVMSSQTARRYSEIKTTKLDSYFADKAATAGVAAPRLAADAGRLAIAASQASLNGAIKFAHDKSALGGLLDLSSSNIHVGAGNLAGALNITYDQLNKTGADSVVLGGLRQATSADGTATINVTAANVTVDAEQGEQGKARTLSVGDLTLAGTNSVTLNDGVQISAATDPAKAGALTVKGNGALLRVSGDADASTTRNLDGVAQVGTTGDLTIKQNVAITGGAVVAEGTHANTIAGGDTTGATLTAGKLVLGAQRMVAGNVPDSVNTNDGTTLLLSDKLLTQFNKAQALTLRSFGGMDLYQGAVLGGDTSRSLTLDTANIRVKGGATKVTIKAGNVQLLNTTGVALDKQALDTGKLTVTAHALNGGTGHITVGGGKVGVNGASSVELNAAGSVVLSGNGGLSTPGDLHVSANSLTATQAAASTLQSGGWFELAAPAAGDPSVAAATPGMGAQVTVSAATIYQDGKIALPSGALTLGAKYQLRFGAGSVTDLSGGKQTIDGVALDSLGGTLIASSKLADVTQYAGALIDVSAGSGGGKAGSMSFSAPQGSVNLQGRLLANASSQQSGGSLTIDSGTAVDLNALSRTIAAEQSSVLKNFGEAISVRTRQQGQNLSLDQGSKLAAQSIDLSSDMGDVSLSGALHATSQTGGSINVAAGGHVMVLDGADLQAHADAGNKAVQTTGGVVSLSSSGLTRTDGSLGTVKLLGGNIDTSGLNGGQDGRVKVRATNAALLADNSAVSTAFKGMQSLNVEAVKVIQATKNADTAASIVDAFVLDKAASYAKELRNTSGGSSQAERIAQRMAGQQASLQDKVQVRAGVEIQATGDLTLDTDINLLSWRPPADSVSAVLAEAPVNLTLRAGGNLYVKGSISDGLTRGIIVDGVMNIETADISKVSPFDVIQPGQGGDIRLIGGADLKAAQVMATKVVGSNGDVVIGRESGNDVLVRTTTGDVQIAAARDAALLNPHAVVYTTGQYIAPPDDFYMLDFADFNSLIAGASHPFMTGGGSVNVSAGRDVLALTGSADDGKQYVTDWWFRRKEDDGSTTWWNRYDLFQQGFATFGGGNVAVQAGRDTWNVSASAAAGGYFNGSNAQSYGGGSVSVKANRDVVGGSTFAAANTEVFAGRHISKLTPNDSSLYSSQRTAPSSLVVMYGNGHADVMARNQLSVGAITQAGIFRNPFAATVIGANVAILGQAPDASMALSSAAGNILYTGESFNRHLYSAFSGDEWGNYIFEVNSSADASSVSALLPSDTTIQAGSGAIKATTFFQAASTRISADGEGVPQALHLSLLSRDDLGIDAIQQAGSDSRVSKPSAVTTGIEGYKFESFDASSSLTDGAVRDPVRLVSLLGDVSYANQVHLTQPLRMIAGRDIKADQLLSVQHQSAKELSLIQAGRDIALSTTDNQFGIELQGPGDLIVAAGRSLDLHATQGIRATGNRSNPELPAQSANITVLTGVSFAKGDVLNAANSYFELLGGAGVGDFAADLYAQLSAQSQGQSLPQLGSGEAKAFAALSLDEQLAKAQAMVGDAAFQQRVLSFMQHRENPSLTLPEALAQFNSLAAVDKAPMVGLLLSSAWAAKLPQADQLNTALSMAASRNNPYTDKLVSFMEDRTGQVLTPAEADTRFKALNPEEQLLFSSKVLVNEMNAATSKASNLTGAAKNEAYINAYNALDTMFPSIAAKHADLQMGASTIQTQQKSEINVFAPNGGVNVGQMTASSGNAEASKLGLMTAGSGNLNVAARDDILVNQSRVFTVTEGDELIWSSTANVDAGRGGKTVTAAASPIFYLDNEGKLQVDVTSAISGSGIKASGVARVAAPKGEINAGDAGISAGKGLELAATFIRGADNIQAPTIAGAPPPAAVNAAGTVSTPTQPTAAGTKDAAEDGEGKAKKRKKRNILLDFLGFGSDN